VSSLSEEGVKKASQEDVVASIVQVLQSLYTATRSVLIYPPENPTITNMLEAAYQTVINLVPDEGSLDLSIMKDNLVVNGEILDDALQKRRIVQNFVELIEAKKLSSITFWSGLTEDELRKFLTLLASRSPTKDHDEVSDIYEELREEEIQHIEVDEQVYVAISRREKVVDARAAIESQEDAALKLLKDQVFSRFIAGEVQLADIDPSVANEIMSDPDKIVAMVQGFVSSQGWDAKVEMLPFRIDETRGILERVSELIRQVDDPLVRSKLGGEVSKITDQLEAPQLTEMLITSAGGGGVSSSVLSGAIIPLLGDVKMEAVAESAIVEYQRLMRADSGDDWPTSRMTALKSVLDSAMASASPEVAGHLSDAMQQAGVDLQEAEKTASAAGAELAKELMSGGDAELCDGVKGPALIFAATFLFEKDRDDLGSMVMEKLTERFARQSDDAKSTAANQLWGLSRRLRDMGKEAFAAELIDDVSKVFDKGGGAAATFSELTRSMGEVAGGQDYQSVAAGIASLRLGTGTPVSIKSIEALMASDTGKVVQAVFESGDKSAQEAISRVLLGMGDRAAPALIDTAQDSTDLDSLQSIADSLSQLKSDPLPRIAARFQQELETFQLVNLIRLIGLVGDESSAPFLATPLESEDGEVRAETIHVLGRLGGKQALQMLLNESAELDVSMRSAAVRELGRFHDYQAVRRFLEIVAPKKKGELAEDNTVMISACRSLGELRVRQAVAVLSEIARAGRRHEAHPETVRAVAAAALGMIGDEDAVNALKHLLKDSSMLVRSTAKKALGTM